MKALIFFVVVIAGLPYKGYCQLKDTVSITNPESRARLQSLLTGKFFTENEKGKVKRLPLDQMPCFVPNKKSSVPIPTKVYSGALPFLTKAAGKIDAT